MGVKVDSKTLCWECNNSCTKGCSWSESFTPVDGWVATKEELYGGGESYCVIQCPLFTPDDVNRNPNDMDDEGCILLVKKCLELARKDYIEGREETRLAIERFIRGKGASRLHGITNPDEVIKNLQEARQEYKKRRAMQARIGG